MATQMGMGLTRVILLVGTGVGGTIMLRNGRLADILSELQMMLEKGEGKGDVDANEAIANQIRRLAMEVRQLGSGHQITVIGGNSGQGVKTLILPAAALGAIGYAYMKWKGFSFNDLMYVTKQNMANAVSSMNKHLEQVSAAISATKRHLTQRIEKVDDKLEEQKQISGIIKEEVSEVRMLLGNMGTGINSLKDNISDMNLKVLSMEEKQNFLCSGVMYLCQFADNTRMAPFLQESSKFGFKRFLANGENKSQKGLRHLLESIECGSFDSAKTNAILDDTSDVSNSFVRIPSFKMVK